MIDKYILIIGANGGIGCGFVEKLINSSPESLIFATYRRQETAQKLFDLISLYPEKIISLQVNTTEEKEIIKAIESIKYKTNKLDLVINCVGVLHDNELQPEKSLKHINKENLLHYFEVNTIPTVLWAKHLIPLFKHSEKSIFATISAKVGSIQDNGIGGWYGYRASKAGLNMFIKNISIEYSRVAKKTVVVALHPGTTATNLSAPFQKNVPAEKLFSVSLCTEQLLSVINNLTEHNNGMFFSWDGTILPW